MTTEEAAQQPLPERDEFTKYLVRRRRTLAHSVDDARDGLTPEVGKVDIRLHKRSMRTIDKWLESHTVAAHNIAQYIFQRWRYHFDYEIVAFMLHDIDAPSEFEVWLQQHAERFEYRYADCAPLVPTTFGVRARITALMPLLFARFAMTKELRLCIIQIVVYEELLDAHLKRNWSAYTALFAEMSLQTAVWQ